MMPGDEANTVYLFISLYHRVLFPGLWNKHQKIAFPPQLSVSGTGSHLLAEDLAWAVSLSLVGVWNPPAGSWSQFACTLHGPTMQLMCGWAHPMKALSKLQGRIFLFSKPKSFFLAISKVELRNWGRKSGVLVLSSLLSVHVDVCTVCTHMLLNSDWGFFRAMIQKRRWLWLYTEGKK